MRGHRDAGRGLRTRDCPRAAWTVLWLAACCVGAWHCSFAGSPGGPCGRRGDRASRRAARNPFDTLGLPRTASFSEVKPAFRKLARKYHPDVPGTGNKERFQALTKAAEELSSPAALMKWKISGVTGVRMPSQNANVRHNRYDPWSTGGTTGPGSPWTGESSWPRGRAGQPAEREGENRQHREVQPEAFRKRSLRKEYERKMRKERKAQQKAEKAAADARRRQAEARAEETRRRQQRPDDGEPEPPPEPNYYERYEKFGDTNRTPKSEKEWEEFRQHLKDYWKLRGAKKARMWGTSARRGASNANRHGPAESPRAGVGARATSARSQQKTRTGPSTAQSKGGSAESKAAKTPGVGFQANAAADGQGGDPRRRQQAQKSHTDTPPAPHLQDLASYCDEFLEELDPDLDLYDADGEFRKTVSRPITGEAWLDPS